MNMHAPARTSDADLTSMIRRELIDIRPEKLADDWSNDAGFTDDLGLDSLDLVEMVARLEQWGGFFVPDEDIPILTSVAATVAYIRTVKPADG